MATAALSPNSVLASPIQVNPQVKIDLQSSVPQVAQDIQKVGMSVQTDTITISPQALKMADSRNSAAKEASNKSGERLRNDKMDSSKNTASQKITTSA